MSSTAISTTRRLALLARIKNMQLKIAGRRAAMQMLFIIFALLFGVGGIAMLILGVLTVLADAFGLVVGAFITGATLSAISGAIMAIVFTQNTDNKALLLDNLESIVTKDITNDLAHLESGFRRIEAGTKALFKGDLLSALANLAGSIK